MARRFNLNKFIKSVFNDDYALVIGPEIILNTEVESSGDIHKYLLQKVNENYGTDYSIYHEIALDKSERINPVRELIESGEINLTLEDLSPELKSLLETKMFTTILTTTTDGLLEALMRKIWGSQLRVVNIYDKETVDELQNVRRKCRRNQEYKQPTLIYVFGKMDPDDLSKKYIRTDDDAIRLIEKWMRMDLEENNELLQFIRSKRLLSLGCKYNDWYFRFFWYVLTGDLSSNDNFQGKGEVAFTLSVDDHSEYSLQQFLDRNNICVLGDARSFVSDITKTLTQESENGLFRNQIMQSRHTGGLFISYCSSDALTASQLFFRLSEKRYDVWLDSTRLYGGDNYEKEIAEAIHASKVFIALLSPQIADDLKLGSTDNYYNKEWRIAQQFHDKAVIPLAVNGYDLRRDYHQSFEAIAGTHTGYNLMDSDGFFQLITAINQLIS